ncbi:hydroxyacid dehydrogenase [Kribbella pittospori]|uniref:Hydroxyacid dehydrogenase n=1 Tax=Kribbella pittospori TaxID=722689 RepID=A0A4R0JXS6_9ACTN|nr:hydroxyacid dehydrogenase [Kribbella pittospori]TCC51467.1 hydroxyacid dehydrogenase [Kribbella pittospori]
MNKLAVAMTPNRADDVISVETRALLEQSFDMCWAGDDLTSSAIAELARGSDVLLTSWGTPQLGKEIWADGNGPKVVAHAAGSVKRLIDPVIFDHGVAVFSGAGRIAWSVGEYCLAALLTLSRKLPRFDAMVKMGGWKQTGFRGNDLAGSKIGLLGASSTARALITLLKPFGCDIVVYDPYLDNGLAAELGVRSVSLAEALSCPFVSVHVPDVPATKGMVTRDLIERIPDGAIVVNSARGPAIDQKALLEHALTGRIYAALDVYDPEPPAFGLDVLEAPNLLLTPHIAADTTECHLALTGYVITDVLKWLEDGTKGRSFVDPAVWSIAA